MGKLEEIHAIFIYDGKEESFELQYQCMCGALLQWLHNEAKGFKIVLKRYFVSDATNQKPLMTDLADNIAVIQQPPLDGSKVAMWIYLNRGNSNYLHFWSLGRMVSEGNSLYQATTLLEQYEHFLNDNGMTLADNCIRTWFYVRDVDTQYGGLVKGRRENFVKEGLTEKTHYLASTGIQGIPADPKAIIQLGAYAIKGLNNDQQKYLYAHSHLNPTYEYGVTFERGVKVEYGDRSHIYISGTASINNKGEVVHIGDIKKQTLRMWENVEALLNEGGARYNDVMQIIVYLRDIADYDIVNKMFADKFPDTPFVITYAPVCRPTWLIEMECIAVIENKNSAYKDF